MKALIEYSNYRDFLNDLIYGPTSKRGLQTELSRAMGCQAAYFSQVLKGKAELTEDHAIRLSNHLNFNDFDSEYFLLLLRISRAATRELVQYLERKRSLMIQQSEELSSKIKAKGLSSSEKFLAEYFSNWIPSTVHIATSIENFQTPTALASRLSLSIETIERTLAFLEKSQLVERVGERYIFRSGSIHLPRTSPFHQPHQTGRRLQALRAIQQNEKDNLHFSSVHTLDRSTYLEVKEMLSKAIEQSHKKIHAAASEDLFAMCLDFFRVI